MQRAALLTALLAGALLLAGCNEGTAESPTLPPTATPAPIGAPGVPVPTPNGGAPVPASPRGDVPSGTESGIDAVDRVLETVLARSARGLATMMVTEPVECTEQLGASGPPKCFLAPGHPAEGTPVEVFPLLGCELEWQFETGEAANRWMSRADELHAVVRLDRPVIDEPGIPVGEYGLIFTGDHGGHALVVDDSGEVVMAISLCGGPPGQYLDDSSPFHGPALILRGPAFNA